ncbi:hypothetical protein A1Q2_05998 [Trichosporon asahii var. asahii CBS 8904]|uniref:Uncharacterized protein n=2 Tax=Trichosporon asahii var. asahii TaxID=189963 RepID=K1WDL2_TRIAC|nr:hypothetical protein A1Q1_04547 [Trichosporon asahii var. asahii CBS 2479]EJT52336.1 hypothetical protein A1Q1_04547 [Trichosporon asahii var. asahii CBS 2479]EKC99688.1 hypothetical protein A1Q2_05998 [Trichosporon asahii var. asahii CBS 8904]
MFEEDFERCFICQQPCKGLYCSAECKQQDNGTPSPAIKPAHGIHLTAQLPSSLSPRVRPVHQIAPSPIFSPRRRGGSSSSSSISESPIQSPATNPVDGGSPNKECFNLPPPAYPTQVFGSLSTMPVKIPSSSRTPVMMTVPLAGTTAPSGTSVETLRFGRKSSVTNSVTSPLALLPRCGCGRPIGHRARSRDRSDAAEAISCLSLGPNNDEVRSSASRVCSDSSRNQGTRTPNILCPALPEERSITHVLGSSLLSRSRSDPHPPSPRASMGGIHPRPALELSGVAAPMNHSPLPPVTSAMPNMTLPNTGRETRGRSRERVARPDRQPVSKLTHHEEREVAPSRLDRNSRERSRERNSRERGRMAHSRSRSRPARRSGELALGLSYEDRGRLRPQVLA